MNPRPHTPQLRRAFTLIEMMVVAVIIGVLASLSLAGLAVARQRVRIDKTRSTIRKLSEVVVPHYDSYALRRVPSGAAGNGPPAAGSFELFTVYTDTSTGHCYGPRAPNGAWAGPYTATTSLKPARVAAQGRLQMRRLIVMREMPDSWGDVAPNVSTVVTSWPTYVRTAPVRAYANFRAVVAPSATNSTSECLHMIVARGGIDSEAMEGFRADEIGDTDGDGAPEFIDAWGTAIGFARWAPAIPVSPVQIVDTVNYHDPFDPQRVDFNHPTDARGFALIPLIFSAGPNRLGNISVTGDNGWQALLTNGTALLSVVFTGPGVRSSIGGLADPTVSAAADNITNHDLTTK